MPTWNGDGCSVFLFLLGWFYAFVWRQRLVQGGMWIVIYTALIARSVYLVAQAFIAILFRVLLMSLP